MYDPNKRIIDATLSDLHDLLTETLKNILVDNEDTEQLKMRTAEDNYLTDTVVRGLEGIQQALSCGKTKASQIKKTGVLDDAIDHIGSRDYIVHVEKARILYNQSQKVS